MPKSLSDWLSRKSLATNFELKQPNLLVPALSPAFCYQFFACDPPPPGGTFSSVITSLFLLTTIPYLVFCSLVCNDWECQLSRSTASYINRLASLKISDCVCSPFSLVSPSLTEESNVSILSLGSTIALAGSQLITSFCLNVYLYLVWVRCCE
jgi:hypothetical protein